MTAAPGRSTTVGFVAGVVLCVVLAAYAANMAFGSIFIGLMSDACEISNPCNITELQFAVFLDLVGSVAVGIVALVFAIIRLWRRRVFAWAIPLAGGLLVTILFLVAWTLACDSAHQNFWNR